MTGRAGMLRERLRGRPPARRASGSVLPVAPLPLRALGSLCQLCALCALCACTLRPPSPPPLAPEPAPAVVPQPPQPPTAPLPAAPARPAELAELGELQSLLIYHQELRALGPAELAREWAGLGALPRSLAGAIRKAMVLGQGRSGGDWLQAQAQLDSALATAPPGDALRPLALLLAARLAEQRRLGEANDRLGQQLRDSQRRNDQLSEKLEALKAIEQRLPAAAGAARPAPAENPR